MNLIEINGGTIVERKVAEAAINFAIKKLMPRMRTLDICLDIVKIEDKVDGYCLCLDPRTFEIEIQSGIGYEDFVTAIFHEMVHVKQHARLELIDKGFIKKWKGEEWISMFTTVDEYMKLPWETEAYRLQEELFEEYTNDIVA